jgi:hypothetical protein
MQAGRVGNKYLTDILVNKVKFRQSEVDECVFYRENVVYELYTDNSILAGPDIKESRRPLKTSKQQSLMLLSRVTYKIS